MSQNIETVISLFRESHAEYMEALSDSDNPEVRSPRIFTHAELAEALGCEYPSDEYYAAMVLVRDTLAEERMDEDENVVLGVFIGPVIRHGYRVLPVDDHHERNWRHFRNVIRRQDRDVKWCRGFLKRIEAGEESTLTVSQQNLVRSYMLRKEAEGPASRLELDAVETSIRDADKLRKREIDLLKATIKRRDARIAKLKSVAR